MSFLLANPTEGIMEAGCLLVDQMYKGFLFLMFFAARRSEPRTSDIPVKHIHATQVSCP